MSGGITWAVSVSSDGCLLSGRDGGQIKGVKGAVASHPRVSSQTAPFIPFLRQDGGQRWR